ncbi:MAG TPA: glycosyltransferase family 1 protein [Caulobacteraceae bacterium]
MARRLTIGLRYKHQDAWVGGVYYVRNLVSAFGLLPAAERPRLIIVGGDKAALEELEAATGYPRLERLSRTRLQVEPAPRLPWPFAGRREEEIDLLLMGSPPGLEFRGVQWVPDFQEHRFPEHFPPEELTARIERNDRWFARHRHVMVSSQDVAEDLARHYGRYANRVHVVRFASFMPPGAVPAEAAGLRRRHGLPDRYFLCANQFWRHKNHALVLRALAEAGPSVPPVVFTGREEDYRDAEHGPSVRRLAVELGLGERARFLGFIPRADQLGLMGGAVAVIQPSLCEGWSTSIEDAKALGRPVLASDIAVHREQLGDQADLFEGDDPAALARLLQRYARTDPEARPLDYDRARRRFAEDLMGMCREVAADFRRRRARRLVVRR